MTDPGRIAQLLFHVDRRVGFGSGFMPPSLLAWAEPRGIASTAELTAVAVGYTGVWAGGDDGSGGAILYYSSNAGRTWRNVTSRLPDTSIPITAIGANPGSDYIYIGTSDGTMFKSSNNGATFATTGAGMTDKVTSIEFPHPDRVWIGGYDGKLKYTDHSTWTDRTSQLGWGASANVLALAQKPQDTDSILVAGTIPTGPTGKLAYTGDGSTFTDRSSLIASATEYHALAYSQIDDRFLIAGVDASTTRVYYTTDNAATGEEISDLADPGGVQYAALHVILDTWAAFKSDGTVYRLVQDRTGDVRLADEVTEIAGIKTAYSDAQGLAYDPTLNRYYLVGNNYLLYTDDIGQVGAYITRALPQGSAIIGQVLIAPCKYKHIASAAGTLIKSGPGKLVGFLITTDNNVAHDVDFYDNTTNAAPLIVKVRVNRYTYGPNPTVFTPAHPIQFDNGLYIYVGHGNTRVLVAYF